VAIELSESGAAAEAVGTDCALILIPFDPIVGHKRQISAIVGAFFKVQKVTVSRSNRGISSFLSACYVWQDTLGFEDLKNPHYWGGSMLTSFLKHARFNSFRELKISNSIFGLGKVYLWVKHSFLLIL